MKRGKREPSIPTHTAGDEIKLRAQLINKHNMQKVLR
jgi:hypothetical protein